MCLTDILSCSFLYLCVVCVVVGCGFFFFYHFFFFFLFLFFFFFQAEDGIRDLVRSRGLGDVYKRQDKVPVVNKLVLSKS